MQDLKSAIELETWAGKNIAHNLKFVPEEKYSWKAGPEAKSIKDIVQEVVDNTVFMGDKLGAKLTPVPDKACETISGAQATLEKVTAEYSTFLGTLQPTDIQGEVDMGGGVSVPKSQFVTMPVAEALHHHGQVAFIQTLWGDTKTHFFSLGS